MLSGMHERSDGSKIAIVPADFISEYEAAKLIGVACVTMRRWRRLGIGPAWHRLGPRLIRYEREACLAFLRGRGDVVEPPSGG